MGRRADVRRDGEEILLTFIRDMDRVVDSLPDEEMVGSGEPGPSASPRVGMPRTLGVGFGLGLRR